MTVKPQKFETNTIGTLKKFNYSISISCSVKIYPQFFNAIMQLNLV